MEVKMLTLVLFFFLALGASFVCSISESGFLSLSRADIAGLISKGRRKGKVLEGMKNKVDKPLAAILTLNTVANMVGAAGAGAAANTIWGNHSEDSRLAIRCETGRPDRFRRAIDARRHLPRRDRPATDFAAAGNGSGDQDDPRGDRWIRAGRAHRWSP